MRRLSFPGRGGVGGLGRLGADGSRLALRIRLDLVGQFAVVGAFPELDGDDQGALRDLHGGRRGGLRAAPGPARAGGDEEDDAGAGEREVPAEVIGQLVMESLRAIDDVAYVRFASVYRRFQEATDFVHEVKKLEAKQ